MYEKEEEDPYVDGVSLFEHRDFGGHTVDLEPGNYNMHELRQKFGVQNDSVSSCKVGPGFNMEIYEHGGYRGKMVRIDGPAHVGFLQLGY